jgi:hypothetical protein
MRHGRLVRTGRLIRLLRRQILVRHLRRLRMQLLRVRHRRWIRTPRDRAVPKTRQLVYP